MRPAALAMLLLSLCWWLYLEHVDPHYDGRRASEWLRQLNSESDEDTEAAERAIFILGESAVPQIRKFFYAKEPEWQWRLKERIEELTGWEMEGDRDSEDNEAAGRAIEILGKNAVTMVPALIETLDDDDWGYPSKIAIGLIGPSAVPYLKEMLSRHADDGVRSELVRLLFEQDCRDIVPELKDFLKSDHPRLRSVSIVALALFNPGKAETLALIRSSLNNSNRIIRSHAVDALGYLSIHDSKLVREFLDHYHDKDEMVRRRVVRRLAWACSVDSYAIDLLVKSIDDPSDFVKHESLQHLCSLLNTYALIPRWAPNSPEDDPHVLLSLPYSGSTPNREAVFARMEEILPKLRDGLQLGKTDFNAEWNDTRSLRITAMLFLDPLFRPHILAIYSEAENAVFPKIGNSGDIDWGRTIGTGKISATGWVSISEHLNEIKQIDPQVAKIVYWRLLIRHQAPPAELTKLYKPL